MEGVVSTGQSRGAAWRGFGYQHTVVTSLQRFVLLFSTSSQQPGNG